MDKTYQGCPGIGERGPLGKNPAKMEQPDE